MILDFDLMSITPYHVLTQLFASGVLVNPKEGNLEKLEKVAYFLCDSACEDY